MGGSIRQTGRAGLVGGVRGGGQGGGGGGGGRVHQTDRQASFCFFFPFDTQHPGAQRRLQLVCENRWHS